RDPRRPRARRQDRCRASVGTRSPARSARRRRQRLGLRGRHHRRRAHTAPHQPRRPLPLDDRSLLMNVTATSTADQQLHDAPGNNAAADASIHSTGGSFGRVVRAELQRALRPASLLIVAAGASLFAIVAGVSVWLAADDSGPSAGSRAGGARLADLAGTGGATEAFAVGASFGGFLAFVTFIALMAGEFSGGTFRAMLLRYPHRTRLIIGKLVGLLLVASAAIALAELATVAVSWLMAPTQDVATDQWFSMAS